jgi:uncharacterized protein
MPAYLAPGVYLRPKRTDAADVRLVRTDVAAFLGFAERGPLRLDGVSTTTLASDRRVEPLAVRLTSWDEFRATFGGLTRHGFLPFAVRGFFENGGTTCYVVRVAAVDHEDPLQRPRIARWVFPGAGDPIASGHLLRAASVGTTTVATDLVGRLISESLKPRSTVLVELVAPDGGGSEFHVHVGSAAPDRLHLSHDLGRRFDAGSTVRLHEAALEIAAVSAGNWGNRIRLDLAPLDGTPLPDGRRQSVTQFSLRVTVESGPDASHPREREFYRTLSLTPSDPFRSVAHGKAEDHNPLYAPDHVNARSRVIRVVYPPARGPAAQARRTPTPIAFDPGRPRVYLAGGQDGLAGLSRGRAAGVPDEWVDALAEVEPIDEVAILCAPDLSYEPPIPLQRSPRPASPPCAPPPRPAALPDVVAADVTAVPAPLLPAAVLRFQSMMLDQCESRRDRVAILDPSARARSALELLRWRDELDRLPNTTRRFAATYGPWFEVPDPTSVQTARRRVPPSGHVAGVYAQIDNAFGVQRPPANVALIGVIDAPDVLSAIDQEALNPRGINVLRAFPGRGLRVWGARSLSDEPEWRFIHVRRLLSMIEESVEDSTQWTVFEPNDDALRRTLVHSLSVFLGDIWERGGLKGRTQDEAFYVKCDETNNPPAVTEAGQIVCAVGIAIAAPMEFLVFEIRQAPEGATIVEA